MIPENKREELINLCNVLHEIEQQCAEHDCYNKVLEHVHLAQRAIEQFNSGIEIIVCMGMLKAGKSTLVNLLTRSDMASPTGYGQDMTLRPALIRMAEPGAAPRIVLYERAERAAESDPAPLLAVVLDHLRGIAKEGALSELSIRTLPLNDQTLRGVLCHRVTDTPYLMEEPVLVVVETEYNENCLLLRHRNRMILDMPGCDSSSAEVARGERYREIGKECDMLLLLQSSVAPLNAKAVDELKALLDGRTPSTARVIQNRMESKAWLRAEVLEAEVVEQSSRALSILRQLAENRELPVSSVNLGMAYAGIFEGSARLRKKVEMADGVYKSSAELLAGSGFEELETSLDSELSDIRYLHCCDVLRQALRSLAAATRVTQRNEGKVLAALRQRLDRWCLFEKEARKALTCPPLPTDANFSIAPGEMPDFALICENIYRDRRDLYSGPKASGRNINECMIDCNQACREAMHTFLYSNLTDRHVQMTVGEDSSTVSAYCNRTIRHLLKSCKQTLQEFDAELWSEFSVPEHPDFQDWQEVHAMTIDPSVGNVYETRFNPYIYEERVHRWWWKDGEKQYEVFWGNELFIGQVIEPMVRHYCEAVEEVLRNKVPSHLIREIINSEVQKTTTEFFSALSGKRVSTQADIARAEKRLVHLNSVVKNVHDMLEVYESSHRA